MFERYTEDARKSIFHARHEAIAAGSSQVGPAHLLLGLMQADGALALRLFYSAENIAIIRKRFMTSAPGPAGKADLPFTRESRRALAYAAEESERMKHPHIGTEHIMVGLNREEDTAVSALFQEMGLTLERLRDEATGIAERKSRQTAITKQQEFAAPLGRMRRGEPAVSDRSTDLTLAAAEERLNPLIGREAELARMLEILARRYRNRIALTGEAGVGKTALLEGLAQRLEEGAPHDFLGGRRVLLIEAALLDGSRDLCEGSVILCVEGLFDLPPKDVARAVLTLEGQARRSDARLIATGTPEGFRRLAEPLVRPFALVELWPPSEAETIRILTGLKERYEKFHAVAVREDAIRASVLLSRRFLSRRLLPDRALDLLDDACAAAHLKGKPEAGAEDVEAALRARRA
ncbi:MAG: Clp protease N-terminal domain-containing protein [Candidatus Sulfopaludibacter sp.]|nr:Clp protease N-terminal domain-containing protein [Candidatus Sulfopaludibacter sp.]